MLEAALWGLITSSSLLVGAWLSFAFRPGRRVVGLTMGFGAGALISAVAYDLVLDAFDERVVWPALGLAAGALAFFVGDVLIDRLGLHTMEAFQTTREQLILRQQEEISELSTPVIKLWDGVLALPLIGTLDTARTQIVMENLLQRIVDTGSRIAILDITGVPTVDTLVAQHLLKTVAAARLMGADCIISGIRPQIAQTIVHLGLELNTVATKATLADAFALALQRMGLTVTRATPRG